MQSSKLCGHHALKDSRTGRSPAGALEKKNNRLLSCYTQKERMGTNYTQSSQTWQWFSLGKELFCTLSVFNFYMITRVHNDTSAFKILCKNGVLMPFLCFYRLLMSYFQIICPDLWTHWQVFFIQDYFLVIWPFLFCLFVFLLWSTLRIYFILVCYTNKMYYCIIKV